MTRARSQARRWAPWAVMALVLVGRARHRVVAPRLAVARRRGSERSATSSSARRVRASRSPTSDAPAANAIRTEIRRRLEQNQSEDQITDYLVSRYGEGILLEPSRTGIGALVWIVPVVAVVIAFVAIGFRFRGWRARPDTMHRVGRRPRPRRRSARHGRPARTMTAPTRPVSRARPRRAGRARRATGLPAAEPRRPRARARRRRHRRARLPDAARRLHGSRGRGPARHRRAPAGLRRRPPTDDHRRGASSPSSPESWCSPCVAGVLVAQALGGREPDQTVTGGIRQTPSQDAKSVHRGIQPGERSASGAAVLPEGAQDRSAEPRRARLPGLDAQPHGDDAGNLQPADGRAVPRRRRPLRRRGRARPILEYSDALAFAAIIAFQRGKPRSPQAALRAPRPEQPAGRHHGVDQAVRPAGPRQSSARPRRSRQRLQKLNRAGTMT